MSKTIVTLAVVVCATVAVCLVVPAALKGCRPEKQDKALLYLDAASEIADKVIEAKRKSKE